ncbi:SDR family NAD(P)-dependent oxidoreductase [Streptomyces sp. TS71-3]|uniref:SDR family NAD(P)-dependent oxidoreductase n=1 Tax=Streptomyces sp. TS71-3 TaxID=2733862 RepID=UPI001B098AFB|nr:SDR family oxidoreductase [Streptomyces sp. TS71-3]GHJ39823.1 short-chain dehydrogenase [Streptomyces sp. TS71-3]
MDLGLAGRRAVVTGGSRGIGFAVGRALAAEGAAVALVARNAQGVKEQADRLSAETGAQVIGIAADTGDDASVSAMAEAAFGGLGGVDILVNNAAAIMTAVSGEDHLEEQLNVKVRGYLRCIRALTPGMAERGWGRVVNIAGLAARHSGSVTGSIRNVAVAAMTKNLADELGPQGINVTVVHPGATRTESMLQAVEERAAAAGLSPADVERQFAESVSIGRLVEPEEVASVVAFLASPLSVAINGDAVSAGGGAKGAIHY